MNLILLFLCAPHLVTAALDVVHSVLTVAPIESWAFVSGPSYVVRFLVSFLVLQSSCQGRESWFILL